MLAATLASLLAMTSCGGGQTPSNGQTENFDNGSLIDWDLYSSKGHAGNGLRRPAQVKTVDGVLTITGSADGTTGGLSWLEHTQKYGQWDVRLRAPAGCACYHPVVLLWGADGGSGVNNPRGEIDLVEVFNNAARTVNSFSIHYGDGSQFLEANVRVDLTQWHTYHLIWKADVITTWIDDNPAYFTTTRSDLFPPGGADVAIQLDWFPQDGTAGGPTASMQVDYVAQYVTPIGQPPPST
jgi:licheninase